MSNQQNDIVMFPVNDSEFEEHELSKVSKDGDGWIITRSDGACIWVPNVDGFEPRAGMTARFYGKGFGYPVRGIFINGVKMYYRTKQEQKVHHEISLYGADCADWLARWDKGESVWSIEMGGLGPSYEQCIHITLAEMLRHMLEAKYDPASWDSPDAFARDRKATETAMFANKRVNALGLSGAQFGAAMNLAVRFYHRGPIAVMTDEQVKDRHIQVQRTFPVVD